MLSLILTHLFKTSERMKILETVLKKEKITVSQITRETGVSKGMVSRYLKTMKEKNFLHREKQTYYIINHARTRALKILMGLQQLKWDEISPIWVESAGLYGSMASVPTQSLVMWIYGSKW
ncbi:helix-turn-helix domain-containing protein [uncultured Methanobacterium sp.]|uniref:helix-turn-helix domain-containing protein n=1 Tax=uncultured Methanobacterium sp. TaxID=176306 RepID=UPI002AA79FAD|nr:helix-turn-helix domain-containing protein [uncultured Methanobacterium sp.]